MQKLTIVLLTMVSGMVVVAQEKTAGYDHPLPGIRIAREPRFLVNMHKGYSVGMGSTFKFYPDDISAISIIQTGNSSPSSTIRYANPTKGLGDGFKTGIGVAYILNDFINIGVDFDHFNSTIRKDRDSSFTHTNINNTPDEYYYTEKTTIAYDATLLTLTPNITFKAIARPKWYLYNKLGAIITFRPNSEQQDVTNSKTTVGRPGAYKDSLSVTSRKYEWSIRNPAYGFMAALGAQMKLGEKLRGFAEVQFSHIVFVIQKRTLVNFFVDSKSLENTLPVSRRELEFVPAFTTSSVNNNPNMPSQTIVQRIPITYLGLQVGLAWQF